MKAARRRSRRISRSLNEAYTLYDDDDGVWEEYESLDELKADLKDISMNTDDWEVEDPEGNRTPVYSLDEGKSMKVSKRQLKRIIKEEKARVLAEQDIEARRVDPMSETNAAYDLIMDLVTEELYAGPHGEPAGRERIQAWISALQSAVKDLQNEMPPRDESEFITLRDPGA